MEFYEKRKRLGEVKALENNYFNFTKPCVKENKPDLKRTETY